MTHPMIGKFFSPRQALIALGIGLAGCLGFGLLAWAYYTGHKIYLMLVLISAGLILVSPVYFFAAAFPKGCRACNRAFEKKKFTYPMGWQDALRHFLHQPEQGLWQQLVSAPQHGPIERVCAELEHCASCGRIGQLEISIEDQKQDWELRSSEDKVVVEAPLLGWLLQIADARAPQAQGRFGF